MTKLSLLLNKKTIERTTKIAIENNERLSSLLEIYFKAINDKEDFQSDTEKTSNDIEPSGIINMNDKK